MKKSVTLALIIWAMAVAVYIVFLGLIIKPDLSQVKVICSLIFVLIAFVLQIAVGGIIGLKKRKVVRELFLRCAIQKSAAIYLVLQCIIASIAIKLTVISPVISFFIQFLLLSAILIIVISRCIQKQHIEKINNEDQQKVFWIRIMRSEVELLLPLTKGELYNELKKLAAAFRLSDPMSSEHIAPIEREIEQMLLTVKECIATMEVEEALLETRRIVIKLKKRNDMVKLIK